MAHHFGDNVHTKSFTPREYQVELLDAAKERNIIVCLGTESGKSFIAMKLIQEMANETRRPYGRRRDGGRGGKRTLYLVEQKGKAKKVAIGLRNLTDLTVSNCWRSDSTLIDWSEERWLQEIRSNQVLVMGSKVCYGLLKREILSLKFVNLLILDQCHQATKSHPYTMIMLEFYKRLPRNRRPRILGLTAPLLLLLGCPASEGEPLKAPHPGCLEARLEKLEKILDCTAETASDIVSLLRYCPRPRELVVEWSLAKEVDPMGCILTQSIESELIAAWTFLQDHRYDPMEIYQDAEFAEELSCIPDPKIDPIAVLKDFVHILHTLGPWCADRAALLLLIHLDKLKVKTPYERHFLLLCMMTTVMVKIRGICELTFQDFKESERIYKFSTPKVLRFLEILQEFLPPVAESTPELQNNDNQNASSGPVTPQKTLAESNMVDFSAQDADMAAEILVKNSTQCDVTDANTDGSKHSCVDDNQEVQSLNDNQEAHCVKECNDSECVSETGISKNEAVPSELSTHDCDKRGFSIKDDVQGKSCEEVVVCPNVTDRNTGDVKGISSNPQSSLLPTDEMAGGDEAFKNGPTKSAKESNHNRNNAISNKEGYTDASGCTNREPSSWDRGGRGRRRGGGRGRGRGGKNFGRGGGNSSWNKSGLELPVSDALCGIVFVDGRFTAKILYHLLNDLRRSDPRFAMLAAQYTVGCSMPVANDSSSLLDPREAEAEYRKQEEVLKRFRTHECNLLIGPTGWALEDGGLELPRCNLVLRFDHGSLITDLSSVPVSPQSSTIITENIFAVEESSESTSEDLIQNEKMFKQKHNSDLVKHASGEGSIISDIICLNETEKGQLESCRNDNKSISVNSEIAEAVSSVADSIGGLKITEDKSDILTSSSKIDGDGTNDVPANMLAVDGDKYSDSSMESCIENDLQDTAAITKPSQPNSTKEFSSDISSNPPEIPNDMDDSPSVNSILSSPAIESSNKQKEEEILNVINLKTSEQNISGKEPSLECLEGSHSDSAAVNDVKEVCENRERIQLKECIVKRTPVSYHSYARSRARARAPDAHHIIMASEGDEAHSVVDTLAHFMQVEEMLLRRCKNREPPEEEEAEADGMALLGEVYCPADVSLKSSSDIKTKPVSYQKIMQSNAYSCYKESPKEEKACVTLATAIALVNRYCAKLPSDTFTRLTPLWSLKELKGTGGTIMYLCVLRLPINSPVKQDIMGHPMPSRALARRSAALEACKILHQAKELDDDLMPVGKESFRAEFESEEEEDDDDEDEDEDSDEDFEESIKSEKENSEKVSEKSIAEGCDVDCKEVKPLEDSAANCNEVQILIENEMQENSKDDDRKQQSRDNNDALELEEKGEFDSLGVEICGKNGNEKLSVDNENESKEEGNLSSFADDDKERKKFPDEIIKHIGLKINGEVDNEVITEHHINNCIKSLSNITDEAKQELIGKNVSELRALCLEKLVEVDEKSLCIHTLCKKGENGITQCACSKPDVNIKECDAPQAQETKDKMPLERSEEPMKVKDEKTVGILAIETKEEIKSVKERKSKTRKKRDEEDFEEEGEEEGGAGEETLGNSILDRPRPGTTKRRQYYYKRTADALTDCRPLPMYPAYLYNLGMKLVCPLPDEQNTRGRRIHPPEDSPRGFGILTLKEIPKICPFPIFTRSGEVRVCLDPCETSRGAVLNHISLSSPRQAYSENDQVALSNNLYGSPLPEPQQILLTEEQLSKALAFLNYTFAGVLRLQRYLMAFDPVASENSYLIVPTMTIKGTDEGDNSEVLNGKKDLVEVDWEFVDLIHGCKGESKPIPVSEEERKSFVFEASLYHDAVVMPWYRNQDQPQYFYVAEICTHLSPKSSFPGSEYKTFEEYYFKKYSIQICSRDQPLLDVDHTSARLNFLTPRYVNRKGVALPTSSEETKRAKRESLEQKQILVPELCSRHPFPASLWRKAVCLPCILYRLNALLLADQLRARVAREINLGLEKVPKDFDWPPLDFGWSLADVLKKSKESEGASESSKNAKSGKSGSGATSKSSDEEEDEVSGDGEDKKGTKKKGRSEKKRRRRKKGDEKTFSGDDRSDEDDAGDDEDSEKNDGEDWMEIGTWSNEMAMQANPDGLPPLPHNVTMVGEGGREGWGPSNEGERIRYGSPSIWKGSSGPVEVFRGLEHDLEGLETTDSSDDDDDDEAPEDEEGVEEAVLIPEEEVEDRGHHPRGKLRIQFRSDFLAEAVEVLDDDLVDGQILKAITEAGEVEVEEEDDVADVEEEEDEESNWLWDEGDGGEGNEIVEKYVEHFEKAVVDNKKMIEGSGMLLGSNKAFSLSNKGEKLDEVVMNTVVSHDTKKENPLLCVKKFETPPTSPVCKPSKFALLNRCELINDDESESYKSNTNTEDGDFVTMESLSDDDTDDIFLDVLEEDRNWETDAHKDNHESDCDGHGSDSPISSSSSNCSCCSSCTSCSSLISSSEEDLENWPSDMPVEGGAQSEEQHDIEEPKRFSFDAQPALEGHPGPSPPLLLQALTMSNANDGINLERLETIGDSFLKYAITAYLYCTHHSIHEGKLSHLRSKQVSNVNLYRLGKRKRLGESMIAAKFEPHDNWLPPCYHVPLHLERALIRAGLPPSHWNGAEVPSLAALSPAQIGRVVREKGRRLMMKSLAEQESLSKPPFGARGFGETGFKSGSFNGRTDAFLTRREGVKNSKTAATDSSSHHGGKFQARDFVAKSKVNEGSAGGSSGNLGSTSAEPNLSSEAQSAPNNPVEELPCFVPYNLVTQQSIPDKSIADCVEALIGAYLIACGPRGALLFMAWLGIRVLPSQKIFLSSLKDNALKEGEERPVGCMLPKEAVEPKGEMYQVCYGNLSAPPPPLTLSSFSQRKEQESEFFPGVRVKRCKHCLKPKKNMKFVTGNSDVEHYFVASDGKLPDESTNKVEITGKTDITIRPSVQKELKSLLGGLSAFEKHIGYYFQDRSLLLQALTHASYSPNRLTDCYQRLEFLGDAVLDYLITRHLYEDPRQHSPGALTDLRSALVNNTIFASLAVRHGFHRFFLHLSPGLHSVVERFVRMQASNGHAICEEYYLIEEEECEEAEDVEVPKALGDVFESVAGAIFLDSGMSLDAVWNVYYRMMKAEIEQFSTNVPKSPIRELLEMEPETAKFGKPEKLADGRRVRVTVEVFGKGTFKGIGRNYRIAKCTAAKCALRQLKKRGLLFPRKN